MNKMSTMASRLPAAPPTGATAFPVNASLLPPVIDSNGRIRRAPAISAIADPVCGSAPVVRRRARRRPDRG